MIIKLKLEWLCIDDCNITAEELQEFENGLVAIKNVSFDVNSISLIVNFSF